MSKLSYQVNTVGKLVRADSRLRNGHYLKCHVPKQLAARSWCPPSLEHWSRPDTPAACTHLRPSPGHTTSSARRRPRWHTSQQVDMLPSPQLARDARQRNAQIETALFLCYSGEDPKRRNHRDPVIGNAIGTHDTAGHASALGRTA